MRYRFSMEYVLKAFNTSFVATVLAPHRRNAAVID